MKKIIHLLSFIAIACSITTIVAMEKQKMNLFIIPSLHDDQGNDYASNIFSEEQYKISRIDAPFPTTFDSYNKKNYENPIEQTINNTKGQSFLYALKNGVPFAFDYAAKNPDKIAGILAEETTLTELHYLFDLCTKIPKDIPIIFVHNCYDSTPYNNVVALYHHLNTNTPRKSGGHRTSCLGFVDPDHKDIKNTDVLKKIHFFLQINNLPNECVQHSQKTSDIKAISHKSSPNQEEQAHLNKLIKEENKRYYKDWAVIIIPASFLTVMLSWLLYKSGITEKLLHSMH